MTLIPLVQIIHVSDLHVASGPIPPGVQSMLQWTQRLRMFRELVREGVAPYDTKAPRYFRALVERFTTGAYQWNGTTWLLDTGDLTTFGDQVSLQRGLAYLQDIGSTATAALSLHGNHDAWPEDFPACASEARIEAHRHELRTCSFPRTWPEAPLVSSGPIAVHVYGLNSVLHCRFRNSLAVGTIDHDRFWDEGLSEPERTRALDSLQALVDAYDPRRQALRILLTHHPLHFPTVLPWDMVSNRYEVARRIAPTEAEPALMHLVLSGHTHGLFPEHGQLPTDASTCNHGPLAEGQLQLVVGALMQESPKAIKSPPTTPHHQAQVLRLFWNDENSTVELQRTLVAKNSGEPGYRIIPLPDSGGAVESAVIRLR